MRAFDDVRSLVPRQVWAGITARAVHGERLTLAVVELEPRAIAEEHSHADERLGIVLRGSIRFRVGDEERELGPGETWEIPSDTLHRAEAGSDGATVSTSSRRLARSGKRPRRASPAPAAGLPSCPSHGRCERG